MNSRLTNYELETLPTAQHSASLSFICTVSVNFIFTELFLRNL